MTSSLVGSEMCIRDRVRVLTRHLGRRGKAIPHNLRLGLHQPTLARINRPVSYTHLTLPTICSV
eukprot:956978-Prorocentrum_lima.AAC.1